MNKYFTCLLFPFKSKIYYVYQTKLAKNWIQIVNDIILWVNRKNIMFKFLNVVTMGCLCTKEGLRVNENDYTIISKIADGYV